MFGFVSLLMLPRSFTSALFHPLVLFLVTLEKRDSTVPSKEHIYIYIYIWDFNEGGKEEKEGSWTRHKNLKHKEVITGR